MEIRMMLIVFLVIDDYKRYVQVLPTYNLIIKQVFKNRTIQYFNDDKSTLGWQLKWTVSIRLDSPTIILSCSSSQQSTIYHFYC